MCIDASRQHRSSLSFFLQRTRPWSSSSLPADFAVKVKEISTPGTTLSKPWKTTARCALVPPLTQNCSFLHHSSVQRFPDPSPASSQPERLATLASGTKKREMYTLIRQGLKRLCDEGKYHRSAFQVLKSSGGVGGRLIHRSRELFLYTEEVRSSPMRVSTLIPDGQKKPSLSLQFAGYRRAPRSKAKHSAPDQVASGSIANAPPQQEEEESSNIHARCSWLYTHRRSLPFKVHTHTPPLYLAQYPPPHLPSPKPPTTLTTDSPTLIFYSHTRTHAPSLAITSLKPPPASSGS
jgi:hypothetical protein